MAETTSLKFPKMFDVTRNQVSVLEDNAAIVNRDRLLILTEQGELYNNPDFGVGLIRHLWHYNVTDRTKPTNQRAIIEDRIKEQLALHEPYCKAEETQFADGLLFTDPNKNNLQQNYNDLDMTVAITTTYNKQATISIENEVQY